jgi:proteasome lid subunit RPN8/RPN11
MEALKEAASKSWPVVACALLAGSYEGDDSLVNRILPARNASNSPVSFQIDPAELVRLYEDAEEAGEEIVGIFHSHPAPPSPSSTDLRFMKLNPCVWLIESMPSEEIRAYILNQDRPGAVEIHLID